MPSLGVYKLNVNGAIFKADMPAGMGVVARDHLGSVIGALSEQVQGIVELTYIEVMAADRAIRFAAELGLLDIHLEGDALEVINEINKTEFSLSAIRHISQAISAAGASF